MTIEIEVRKIIISELARLAQLDFRTAEWDESILVIRICEPETAAALGFDADTTDWMEEKIAEGFLPVIEIWLNTQTESGEWTSAESISDLPNAVFDELGYFDFIKDLYELARLKRGR